MAVGNDEDVILKATENIGGLCLKASAPSDVYFERSLLLLYGEWIVGEGGREEEEHYSGGF